MRTALPKLIIRRPSSSLHIRRRAARPSKNPNDAITYQKCIAICLRLRGGECRGPTSPLTDVEYLVADGTGGESNLELTTIVSLDRSSRRTLLGHRGPRSATVMPRRAGEPRWMGRREEICSGYPHRPLRSIVTTDFTMPPASTRNVGNWSQRAKPRRLDGHSPPPLR